MPPAAGTGDLHELRPHSLLHARHGTGHGGVGRRGSWPAAKMKSRGTWVEWSVCSSDMRRRFYFWLAISAVMVCRHAVAQTDSEPHPVWVTNWIDAPPS